MKKLIASTALFLCACSSTTLSDPQTGRVIARFESNIATGEYSAGGTRFTFTKLNNSTPTNSIWRGTNELGRNLVSGLVSVASPGGSGTATTAVRVIGASVPHVAPKEKSAESIWP